MKKGNFLDKIISNKTLHRFIVKCNRVHFIIFFFVLFCLIILYKLFSYTVFDYKFYKGLADKQQIGEVIVPVTRGTIYSSINNDTVLGTSLNLYDVAIDPTMEGDKAKLVDFLHNIVYDEICKLKSKKICENNLYRFLNVLELEDFVYDEKYIKGLIFEKLTKKIYQEYVTSVFIDKELTEDEIFSIKKLGIHGLYPSGNYLYVNPQEVLNPTNTSKVLSNIIGINELRLKYLLSKRKLKYVSIINKISIHGSEYIKGYIDDEKIALKKGVLKDENSISKFLILNPRPSRYYPENNVASQVMGFVDNSGVGRYGIEGYYENILKGNNGKILSKKDIRGRIIDPLSIDNDNIISEGVKINLTVDRNIQKKIETILERGVKKYQANKGSVIVMDPNNGNILSMANYPNYDLNNYGDVYELEKVKYSKYPDPKIDLLGYPVFVEDQEDGDKYYYDNKEIFLRKASREELGDIALVKYKYKNGFGSDVYRNDIVSSLYEPGSIMKAITVAIGIDTGEIERYGFYLDEGSLTIGDFKISNVSDECLGTKTFANALNYSCNVGMIRIVQSVGKVLLHQYLTDFGFSDITGIDLEGEVYSQIAPWENWSKAQLLTSSYGLGISITQLQMANAYSVIANGGLLLKPNIVDSVEFSDGRVLKNKKEVIRRVIKESTSKVVSDMLVSGANDGVAKNGNVEGYSVAGKTGTSQIPYKGRYEKGQGSTIGSYAGFGPAEDPKFVIVVKLERPKTSNYGGATSAFIFHDVAEYLFDYYGIPKKNK